MNAIELAMGALILMNSITSIAVLRTPFYSGFQKVVQCLIVWLLPLFGAVFVWNFLRSQRVSPQRREGAAFEAGYDNTIVVTDGSQHGHGAGGHGGSH